LRYKADGPLGRFFYFDWFAWSRSAVRFSVGLLAVIITSSLLGACASNGAPEAAQASASEKSKRNGQSSQSGQAWSVQTPFGIVYERIPSQEVDYPSTRPAGTIVVSTSKRRLYYVLGGGKAIQYGIAVGMEGYGWAGVSTVSAKREWPDWTPTPNIMTRFPNLPRHMAGGPDNPLGARALYLGGTLYRIHGTNEPWKLGGGVSSGCIRLSNDDIVDLYNRAKIGATVVVQQ
jgi:lipoprotein-anchoring transpeptidase ErfK/SrfK